MLQVRSPLFGSARGFVAALTVSCSFALVAQPSALAQRGRTPAPITPPPTSAVVTIPGRLAGGGALDGESLLAAHMQGARVAQAGRVAQLSGRQIEVAPGERAALSVITPVLFEEQEQMRRQLGAARGATLGAVEVHDEAYDLGDRVAIVRTTRFVVADVAAAERGSPLLRTYFQGRGGAPRTLTPEIRAGLVELRRELQTAPANHPLRVAGAQSDEALLAAISRGEGELEVVDTFVLPTAAIPMRNGSLMLPTNDGMRFNYSRPRTNVMRAPTPRDFAEASGPDFLGAHAGGSPTVSLETNVQERSSTNGPPATATFEFMNGFTRGRAWEWERRWNYPSGFFRVTFKAGLGFGVRIPIRAHVTMDPSYMQIVDQTDRPSAFMTSVRLETVDADSAFYARTGVENSQIFEGKELVITAYVGYGYKFRALWHDWAYRPYDEWGVDYGENFVPPMSASWQSIREFFIPAEATRTAIDLGIIQGRLEAGVQLAARGRVRATVRTLFAGQPTASSYGGANQLEWRHDFTNPSIPVTWGTTLPAITGGSGSRSFGFEVGNLDYTSDWSLVPGARVQVTVGVDGFHRTFSRSVWFESLRLELGSVTLGRHAGTRQWGRNESGRKVFRNMYDAQQTGPG